MVFAYAALGLVILLLAGDALVKGAVNLSLRMGIPALIVSLTIVAFGTSAPELLISIQAALAGVPGIALGNVVGSNIANLGLIVGVAAVLTPMTVDRKLVRHDMPIMLVSMAALVVFLLDGTLERWEGGVLLAAAIVYTVDGIRTSRREVREANAKLPPEVTEALGEVGAGFKRHILLVVGGVALLVFGADRLLAGAVVAATQLGVSEAVIGLTLVALGTSLPELATTIVAARRGEAEIALGNAIGSNIFNVFSVLGPAALAAPIASVGIGADVLSIMVGFGLVTLLFLYTGGKTRRWEGAVLLLGYLGYIWWLVQ